MAGQPGRARGRSSRTRRLCRRHRRLRQCVPHKKNSVRKTPRTHYTLRLRLLRFVDHFSFSSCICSGIDPGRRERVSPSPPPPPRRQGAVATGLPSGKSAGQGSFVRAGGGGGRRRPCPPDVKAVVLVGELLFHGGVVGRESRESRAPLRRRERGGGR